MQLDQPLKVVTPTVDGGVLAALAVADSAFTGRGVHQLIGRYSAEGVRRSLDRLVGQGVIDVTVVGPSKVYRLNRDHIAAPCIIALAKLREEFLDRLRRRLADWTVPPIYAALFGSAATGQMRPDSDVDVLVVRPDGVASDDGAWTEQLRQFGHDASRWTGNDLRVLEMSEADVRLADVGADHVLGDVRDHGLRLAGPPTYLLGLAHRASGRRSG